METMHDLNTPPVDGADLAERRRVIENYCQMRDAKRADHLAPLATSAQVVVLIEIGTPWREAVETSRDSATAQILRYRHQTGTLRKRYEAFSTSGAKTYCGCPHCLGHD